MRYSATKNRILRSLLPLFIGIAVGASSIAWAYQQNPGIIIVHEKDIMREEEGPHKGGGQTIAFPFFNGTKDYTLNFRKRILKPGAAIGYHEQHKDEIYYILSGEATFQMNGEERKVVAGDAMLTRPGNSHGLKANLGGEVTIFIVY